jgi:PAS domain S-box-containing protein
MFDSVPHREKQEPVPLEEAQYLLKALNASSRRMFVITKDLRILAANRAARERRKEELVGRHCHEAFYKTETPCYDCPAVEILKTHKPASRRLDEWFPKSGNNLCLRGAPIFEDNDIEAVAILDHPLSDFRDSERQRATSFLWEPNSFFVWNLMLSSADGVIAADRKGKILIFNDAASEITGYSVDESLNDLSIERIYPGEGARDIMRKLRSEEYGGRGKLKSHQVDVLRKDGTTVPVSLSAAIVYEGAREVATVGFFRDLREKLEMERKLQKTQVQLHQAEKMSSLGKLAAGVAHQLNNPLGGIALFAQLLLDEYQLEEEATKDIGRIIEDAERCRTIVKELLEFARQTKQEIQPHDLNHALSRTLFFLENQPLFRNLKITKDLCPDLPLVPCDLQQLNHVFMNILLNAAEAMEGKGSLTVRTSSGADENVVRVEISDTGPGIPPEIQPNIFEPYFTTKEVGKGTGLGLSIAYGIIENHHGNISVRSRPGEGATFLITLPATRADRDKSG